MTTLDRKPEDIPQNVWDAAQEANQIVFDASVDLYETGISATDGQLVIARAILDALSSLPAQADTELLRLIANDPNAVHINLLRGSMARPSIEQIIHIYGKEALLAALTPSQPAAVGELLTRAATAARIMMEYDAWEVPAPAPADPIDYAWTAQVINDLAAALVHRDQVNL